MIRSSAVDLYSSISRRCFSKLPLTSTRQIHVGWEKALVRSFGQKEVDQFVNLTGDYNPIHVSEEAAKTHGLSKPIVPGMLLASMFPSIIGTNFPGSIYATQSLAFRGAVQVGEIVEAAVKVTKATGRRFIFQTTVSRNGQVVLDGTALAMMPSVPAESKSE